MIHADEDPRLALIRKAKATHDQMRDLTIKFAGVTEKNYNRLIEKVDLFNIVELKQINDWLCQVLEGPFKTVERVYRMPPNPDIAWDNYEHLEVEGLQEQILMGKAAERLKAAWRTPYKPTRVIRRGKTTEGQSEGAGKHAPAKHDRPTGDDSGINVRSQSHGSDESNHGCK